MAAITSLGIGSGVDINSMVNQLVALESRPLTQMQSAARALQTQISSYGQLQSLFGALQTAAGKLSGTSLWQQSKAASSDDSAVSVVGGSGSGAAAGSYSVSVQNLAASQTVVSAGAYASASEPVGAGTLTIDIGSWDLPPMNFVPQVGRAPVQVTVDGSDTLATLRDKINGAGAGVTASIITDSAGARLALRATDSGQSKAFRIGVADNDGGPAGDGAGLSRFGFDPASGLVNMEQKVPGEDARATVNGIDVVSSSNELSGVVDGLTLRLRKENFGSADIAVTNDREAVKTAVQGFADAFNALAKALAEQTKYDAASKTGGPLQGDSAATGLQRQLRALVNTGSGASAAFGRLSDVGLTMQRDGTLAVDGAKLDTATGNLAELKNAFANLDTGNSANDGFARRFSALATQVLGIDGSLTTRADGLRERLNKNGEDQTRLEERVDRYRTRLVAQYTAMDANLSRLNSLSAYMDQQLAALTQSNSSKR
jgi:flagellar hook-associated protein 2